MKDVLDKLKLMASGHTYPATDDMNFYTVAREAIAEIEQRRDVVSGLLVILDDVIDTLRSCGLEATADAMEEELEELTSDT